jgi:HTH-type transcriptional regulator / antitoxin HigA
MALTTTSNRAFPPGSYLLEELEARGWTQVDLAHILDRPIRLVHEIITAKRAITPETAQGLAAALGTTAELWMNLESAYRLALAEQGDTSIAQRARLFEKAPLREMQRRGWIKTSNVASEVEQELRSFFRITTIDETPALFANARKSDWSDEVTTVQHAWCCRAYQLAEALPLPVKYDASKIDDLESELRSLAAYPNEARKVAKLFATFGVAFVVVEPLQGAKIDGAAFWIGDTPVIAVSIRYDRLDGFWFTVMHELSHIRHRDALAVDLNIADTKTSTDEIEQRANAEASSSLIPAEELQSFVRRIGPLYSKQRIVQFAHTLRIHPGIIVGQLQHLGEVGFHAHREMLVKVRSVVIESALTDGWGKSTTPGIL